MDACTELKHQVNTYPLLKGQISAYGKESLGGGGGGRKGWGGLQGTSSVTAKQSVKTVILHL